MGKSIVVGVTISAKTASAITTRNRFKKRNPKKLMRVIPDCCNCHAISAPIKTIANPTTQMSQKDLKATSVESKLKYGAERKNKTEKKMTSEP